MALAGNAMPPAGRLMPPGGIKPRGTAAWAKPPYPAQIRREEDDETDDGEGNNDQPQPFLVFANRPDHSAIPKSRGRILTGFGQRGQTQKQPDV